jgi:hypothetical protein
MQELQAWISGRRQRGDIAVRTDARKDATGLLVRGRRKEKRKSMIYVSGYSDDLIEIDGAWEDEIGCYDQIATIEFDDGTEIELRYNDNGTWKVKVLRKGSADHWIDKLVCNGDYYSDRFTIDTDRIISVEVKHE